MMSTKESSIREWGIAGAAVTLAIFALMPCLTPTTPVAHFDDDPRLSLGGVEVDVLTALGPTGVAVVQLATVLVAVLGTAAAVGAGARLTWWVVGLAGVGALAAVGHMVDGNARWEDWTRGGAWVAAASVGVAGYHLAQHPAARRWIVALLCAAAIPLAMEAAWDVGVQHAEDVRFFEANRSELLAMRGIEPGSEQAALYERRLRTAEATGVFTTSNLLASVAGALGLAGLGVAWGQWAGRRRDGRSTERGERDAAIAGVMPAVPIGLVCAGAGVLTVWLTTSRGAALAVCMVVGLLAWAAVSRGRKVPRWAAPGLAIVLGAAAFSAVLVRGAVGPPDPPAGGFVPGQVVEGERSLLFRAQYWSASARIAANHPVRGVGSRGFADAYPAAKDPLNPESVTSGHNVFVDWVTMLGVGGVAWTVLVLLWLWLAGWRLGGEGPEPTAFREPGSGNGSGLERRWTMGLALVATGLLFGVVLPVRSGMLYTETALLWLVAMAGFFAVAAMLGARGSLTPSAARLGLFAAAAVVVVHNQIEMTFFQPESMGLMWLLVGAAAAGTARPPQDTPSTGRRKGVGIAAGGALALILVAGMSVYVSGVIRHERAMEEAAAALRRGDVPLAVDRLATAEHAAGWDTAALRWRVRLHAVEPMGPLVQAQRQAEARQRVDDALAWIDTTSATHGTPPTVARLRAQLLDRWAQLNGDRPGDVQAAREAYAELKPRSPFNVQDAWARAELARRAGDGPAAGAIYGEALALREQAYLDPADPLTAAQLRTARDFAVSPAEP